MRALPVIVPLLLTSFWAHGDEVSGPGRTTIQQFAWGTFYYETDGTGPFQFDPSTGGFRFRSGEGEVVAQTTGVNGYRFSCGTDLLTLAQNVMDVDIQGPGRRWTLNCRVSQCTLATSDPPDRVTYTRSANSFTIQGSRGSVAGRSNFGNLTITSPLGTSTVTTAMGQNTASGVAIQLIPYLGRGLFIPFHGVGIFIDMARVFPMPEVEAWVEWKPVRFGP